MKKFINTLFIIIALASLLFAVYSHVRLGYFLDSTGFRGLDYSFYGNLLWGLLGLSFIAILVAFILRPRSNKPVAFVVATALSLVLVSMAILALINTPSMDNRQGLNKGSSFIEK